MSKDILDRRLRYWFGTWNNPPSQEGPLPEGGPLNPSGWSHKPRYLVYQLEVGDSGTPHYQFYVAFHTPVRGSQLLKMMTGGGTGPHLKPRAGKHSEVG